MSNDTKTEIQRVQSGCEEWMEKNSLDRIPWRRVSFTASGFGSRLAFLYVDLSEITIEQRQAIKRATSHSRLRGSSSKSLELTESIQCEVGRVKVEITIDAVSTCTKLDLIEATDSDIAEAVRKSGISVPVCDTSAIDAMEVADK